MTWTVLSDNRTTNDALLTEHGLCVLLDTGRHRILLDTGASDNYIRNAQTLGIDLSTLDYIFISHGHSDHAGGLEYLAKIAPDARIVVSPQALCREFYSKRRYLHSITTPILMNYGSTESLIYGTTDPRIYGFNECSKETPLPFTTIIPKNHQPSSAPKGNSLLFIKNSKGEYINDDFRHELALYTDGFLFTGCAHNGIENILSSCPYPIHTVLGGFHLLDGQESAEELTAIGQRLVGKYPDTQFYTSHCTGDAVFNILHDVMKNHLHHFFCGSSATN